MEKVRERRERGEQVKGQRGGGVQSERREAEIRKREIEKTRKGETERASKPKQLPAIPCFCLHAALQPSWERAKGARVLRAVSRVDLCLL